MGRGALTLSGFPPQAGRQVGKQASKQAGNSRQGRPTLQAGHTDMQAPKAEGKETGKRHAVSATAGRQRVKD